MGHNGLRKLFMNLLTVLPVFVLLAILLFSGSNITRGLPVVLCTCSGYCTFRVVSTVSDKVRGFNSMGV